jgi:hypothetical protein
MSRIEPVHELWSKIARIPNDLKYGIDRTTWHGWDRLTNPGYIGSKFNGVVFLAKNPGNGVAAGPSPLERELFSALADLKADAVHFRRFNGAYQAGLRQWSIGRYLLEANAPLEQVAFLNLIPWRTDPERMNAANWRDAAVRGGEILNRQLVQMRPREIIILGNSTENLIREMVQLGFASTTIERSNGDRFTKPSAVTVLAHLRQRMKW